MKLNYCMNAGTIKVLGILSSVKMVFTSLLPSLTLGGRRVPRQMARYNSGRRGITSLPMFV